MDDGDDLLAMAGLGEKTNDTALKALNATLSKMQQRKEKQQESKKRLKRQAEDLQASLDEKEGTGEVLAEQTRAMEDMRARVVQELDKGDADSGGVEPDVWQQALFPVQALPELQLAELPELQQALQQQQQQLLGLSDTTTTTSSSSSDPQQLCASFAVLLSEVGPCEACPSEAAARAAFYAACYGPTSVALPALNRFMAWCGEPEVVAGCEMMGLAQLCQWSGGAPIRAPTSTLSTGTALADSMTPVTIAWLPSAGDMLTVLAALGYKQQQQQQQRPAKQQKQQQQQQQPAGPGGGVYRRENLQTLLHLLGRIARGHARLDTAGLSGNSQYYLQLLLALLALMLDQGVMTSCRYALVEAFAALLELAPDATWDRLVREAAPGSLLHALSGGLGPSHRACVALLAQMPRSSRGTQLRQLGALQLLSKLIPGAKQHVPPSRISGLSAAELRGCVHRDVQALLGPQARLRALLNSLCVPPGAGSTLQVWLLMSVLEAADLVLWVDVSTPGVGIGKSLCQWLLEWLKSLDRVLDKKLSNHRVRSKVAALENAYTFSELGCVVACAAPQPEEW